MVGEVLEPVSSALLNHPRMVIQRIEPGSVAPVGADVPPYQAWVLDSDLISNINNIDQSHDLEVDFTPFINPADLDPTGTRVIWARRLQSDNGMRLLASNARTSMYSLPLIRSLPTISHTTATS